MKRKAITFTVCAAIVALSSGCARKPSNAAVDPYENFNRVVFAFNQDVDHLIYRPAATIYKNVVPWPLQSGINNAFENIGELTTMSNDLLQGKIKYVFLDFWRFFINSTVGIGGMIDVASRVGLKKHYNDFGMTLAYWSGKVDSPYLQVPFLGPLTFRDAFGLPFDYAMSPYPYLRPDGWTYYPQLVRLVNLRSRLLDTDKLVDDAFDPYIFVRNAYLQYRRAVVEANNEAHPVDRFASPGRYREESNLPTPEVASTGNTKTPSETHS